MAAGGISSHALTARGARGKLRWHVGRHVPMGIIDTEAGRASTAVGRCKLAGWRGGSAGVITSDFVALRPNTSGVIILRDSYDFSIQPPLLPICPAACVQ